MPSTTLSQQPVQDLQELGVPLRGRGPLDVDHLATLYAQRLGEVPDADVHSDRPSGEQLGKPLAHAPATIAAASRAASALDPLTVAPASRRART